MSDSGTENARQILSRALVESLSVTYPGRLDPEQTEQVRRALSHLLDLGAKLKAYPLTNADEPDPIFRAYRREE